MAVSLCLRVVCYNVVTDSPKIMLKHLPLIALLFFILVLGLTLQTVNADARVYFTLLAPVLWLGLYVLGSDHAK